MNRTVLLRMVAGAAVLLAAATGCNQDASPNPPAATSATLVPLTNMVRIPAGSFQRIRYPVTLTRDFWMGRFEVTQADFQRVMGSNPSHFAGLSNHPVEKVSFIAASNYCVRVTNAERDQGRLPGSFEYRLPTEAEWEYACRAGNTNRFHFGHDVSDGGAYAWTAENCEETTHPVGLKKPNAWGLHDMHGNVWEWCSDWFEPYPPRALTDPTGPATVGTNKYKVFKGGGWNQDLVYGGASSRFMMAPSNSIHFVGFRMVLAPR